MAESLFWYVFFSLFSNHSGISDEGLDEVLISGLKRTEVGPRRSLEGKVNLQEINTACMILNTAEYCQTTSLQLEDRVKGKINESLKEDISFQAERDTFAS